MAELRLKEVFNDTFLFFPEMLFASLKIAASFCEAF